MPGSVLLSHGESPTLSSALSVFTTEFGMESGGSQLAIATRQIGGRDWPLSSNLSRSVVKAIELLHYQPYKPLGCYMVKPHGQLVLVSFIHCWHFSHPAYQLCSLQRPFRDLEGPGRPHLEGGFRLDAFSGYPFRT